MANETASLPFKAMYKRELLDVEPALAAPSVAFALLTCSEPSHSGSTRFELAFLQAHQNDGHDSACLRGVLVVTSSLLSDWHLPSL